MRSRGAHATTGDYDGPRSFSEQVGRARNLGRVWRNSHRWHHSDAGLREFWIEGLVLYGVACMASKLQVGGPGLSGRSVPECLVELVRKPAHIENLPAGSGYWLEQGEVFDFLVVVSTATPLVGATGQRDDRGAPQVGIAKSCCKVCRSNVLRHAHARASGSPGVTISHVCRCLLTMSNNALDLGLIFHGDQSGAQSCGNEKDCADPVSIECPREILGTGHRGHEDPPNCFGR